METPTLKCFSFLPSVLLPRRESLTFIYSAPQRASLLSIWHQSRCCTFLYSFCITIFHFGSTLLVINRRTHCLGNGYIKGDTLGSLRKSELGEDLNCLGNVFAENRIWKFNLRGGETALGWEFSAMQHHMGLKIGIKVKPHFKHDDSSCASSVRSNFTGSCKKK